MSLNEKELVNPSTAVIELKISVATLRKYSLIVEKTTGDSEYYAHTSQRTRLYSAKNIEDLKAFHKLAKQNGLTLSDAAQRIFAVNDKKVEDQKKADKEIEEQANALMGLKQVVKLLSALQQTIVNQNQAIADLQKQVAKVQKQSAALIDSQKQLAVPQATTDLPEMDNDFFDEEIDEKTPEQKCSEVAKDMSKGKNEARGAVLKKAQENAAKRTKENVHRASADIQFPKKKHWWERFLG